jgi:hypothetical protein
MEQMDDKETTSSRLKILDAIEYEIPSASKLERPTFRCGEQTMPVHVKLYDSKDGHRTGASKTRRGARTFQMIACRSASILSRRCQALKMPG